MPDLPATPLAAPLAWGLTYLAHSTLLLGLCWAMAQVSRRGADRRAEEGLWKLALVAGLLTTLLQGALGVRPVTGTFELGSSPPTPAPVAATPTTWTAPSPGAAPLVALAPGDRSAGPLLRPLADPPAPEQDRPGALDSVSGAALLALGWTAVALLLGARLAIASLRLAARLRGRAVLEEGVELELLDDLRRAAGIRRAVKLAVSERLAVPIVRGLVRPEICLPARAVRELERDELRSVLAHELAHVARRDALWQLVARLFEIAVPFQPLHRVARRRLAHLFELASDDWAARLTGEPLALARSLAKVAGWTLGGARGLPETATVAALAARPSTLGDRVRRLVQGGAPGPGRAWARATLAALVAGAALAPFTAPAFTAAAPVPPPPIAPEPTVLPVPPGEPAAPRSPQHPEPAPATAAPRVPEAPVVPEAPEVAPAPHPLAAIHGRAAVPPAVWLAVPEPAIPGMPQLAPLAPWPDPLPTPLLDGLPPLGFGAIAGLPASGPEAELLQLEAELARLEAEVAGFGEVEATLSLRLAEESAAAAAKFEATLEQTAEAERARREELAAALAEAARRLEDDSDETEELEARRRALDELRARLASERNATARRLVTEVQRRAAQGARERALRARELQERRLTEQQRRLAEIDRRRERVDLEAAERRDTERRAALEELRAAQAERRVRAGRDRAERLQERIDRLRERLDELEAESEELGRELEGEPGDGRSRRVPE